MTTNLSTRTSAYPRIGKALGLALVSILVVVALAGIGSLPARASAPAGYDNVQVIINTSQNLPYSYTLTAYDTSGFQVAYYQSNFPAAALELPNGTYLFTVTASYSSPTNYPCLGCLRTIYGNSTTDTNSTSGTNSTVLNSMQAILLSNDTITTTTTNSTEDTNSTGITVMPIYVLASYSNEYGYAVEQITGPSSITINTLNATTFPTTQVSIHVAYANGTAAQGAWVYASVVGNFYSYSPNIVSEVQTGADGTAVLTMPQAPLLVTAYLTVPITLPQQPSNATVIIGGQKINMTLNWQPNSVALEGQTLIMPPQTSGNITLQYQPQQYYYPTDRGSSSTPGTTVTTTTMTTTASSTSRNVAQGSIPPFSPANAPVAPHVGPSIATTTAVVTKGIGQESMLLVGGGVAIVVVLAALTLALVTVRGKRKSSIVSA